MNSFLSNATFRITFAANNYETANLISQLCGNKTVKQTSHSAPRFFDLNPATRTMNISEVQRALLLPQEVIQLPRDEQIVLIEATPPIKSKKIKYFDDKFFMARLLPPTFVPTQKPYNPKDKDVEITTDAAAENTAAIADDGIENNAEDNAIEGPIENTDAMVEDSSNEDSMGDVMTEGLEYEEAQPTEAIESTENYDFTNLENNIEESEEKAPAPVPESTEEKPQ